MHQGQSELASVVSKIIANEIGVYCCIGIIMNYLTAKRRLPSITLCRALFRSLDQQGLREEK